MIDPPVQQEGWGVWGGLLFHMWLLCDVTTGGQSGIQSDKSPVAGTDHVSAARLVLPVGGRRCDPESQQMLRPWAGPPVFRPDNGPGGPDFGRCH